MATTAVPNMSTVGGTTRRRRDAGTGRAGAARRSAAGAHGVLGRHGARTARRRRRTLRLRSPDAFRRLLWSPNELGLARAYVAGELDADGDIFELVAALRGGAARGPAARCCGQLPAALRAARRLGVLGRPLPPPPQEARLHGGRHSARRDAAAIEHHYDVGNDFYRLVLGPAMTYSCARFVDDDDRPHDGAGGQARPHLPQARARRR